MVRHWLLSFAALACACRTAAPPFTPSGGVEWTAYGHDAHGTRHSPAAQITRENISNLQVAWVYHTGDYGVGEAAARFETTPLMVDGKLFLTTPYGRVIALDPDSGSELWNYDPRIDFHGSYGDFANRGVSTWRDPKRTSGACVRQLFVATIDARLIALDSEAGQPCRDFGSNGVVNLNHDLINEPQWRGEYEVTSPPAVIHDIVIVGSAIADNQRTNAPSGVVRAFDARSGRPLWKWDPIPRQSGQAGRDTWSGNSASVTGAANAWSIFSVDESRDLVFIPTSSPSPDYYGGQRLGSNLYANSLVALRASTGTMVWHFQAVHHDLWDYDVPAQPVLVDWPSPTGNVPAVVQTTKMGNLFILNRESGQPLLPVEERPVAKSSVAGEEASPTQRFTSNPPLVPQKLTAADAWGMNDTEREACRSRMAQLRSEGIFTPPSIEGTIVFPGNIGGSNWGGLSIDAERQLIITPTNRLPMVVRLIPRDQYVEARRARSRTAEAAPQIGTPYGMIREPLLSPSGVPCNPPPWGALSGVDLRSGAIRWEVPLGFIPQFPESQKLGSINLGGAMTTATGIVFVSGTLDPNLHAFDVENGKEIWTAPLPANGNAMPMTYVSPKSGRQYVVIAAGGHDRLPTKLGDSVVAFALGRAGGAEAGGAPLTGTWRGDLIVGRNRLPTTVTLSEVGDAVTGSLSIHSPDISASVHGKRSGNSVNYTMQFENKTEACSGTGSGTLDIANRGRMLVGEMAIASTCTDSGHESATISLRR